MARVARRKPHSVVQRLQQNLGEGSALDGKKAGHQHQDRAQIEEALHRPHRKLRGEGEFLLARNQVGAGKLAGAAKQSQGGKADDLRRDQPPEAGGCGGLEKNSPADGAHHVGQIDQRDSGADVPQAHAAGVLAELCPIECPPGAKLEIHQGSEDCRNNNEGNNLFLLHSGRASRSWSSPVPFNQNCVR